MSTAYTAWDLAGLSKGRFILGLGTQVKGHIERRYGVKWEAPVPRLRQVEEVLHRLLQAQDFRMNDPKVLGRERPRPVIPQGDLHQELDGGEWVANLVGHTRGQQRQ